MSVMEFGVGGLQVVMVDLDEQETAAGGERGTAVRVVGPNGELIIGQKLIVEAIRRFDDPDAWTEDEEEGELIPPSRGQRKPLWETAAQANREALGASAEEIQYERLSGYDEFVDARGAIVLRKDLRVVRG